MILLAVKWNAFMEGFLYGLLLSLLIAGLVVFFKRKTKKKSN